MSIFSKIKKARQAAAEHKKATEVQAEEVEPLPAPYKHVPTHAAFDALVATPMIYSPEENRARIAAARKTHSERSAFASVTTLPSAQRSYAHLRASSEVNLATHPAHRPRKDLSIDSVIQQPQPGMQQPKLSTRRSLPTMTHENDYSLPPNDFHAFGQPRDAPAPPRRQKPYRASHAASSSSSEARRKSPLSNVPTEETSDDNYSHSSQNSTCSTTSSYEHPESQPGRSRNGESMLKLPRLPKLKFVSHKRQQQQQQQPIEISSPYESNDEYSTATSSIPTWRYEDFIAQTEQPAIVETLSQIHSKRSSIPPSIFHRRDDCTALAN